MSAPVNYAAEIWVSQNLFSITTFSFFCLILIFFSPLITEKQSIFDIVIENRIFGNMMPGIENRIHLVPKFTEQGGLPSQSKVKYDYILLLEKYTKSLSSRNSLPTQFVVILVYFVLFLLERLYTFMDKIHIRTKATQGLFMICQRGPLCALVWRKYHGFNWWTPLGAACLV